MTVTCVFSLCIIHFFFPPSRQICGIRICESFHNDLPPLQNTDVTSEAELRMTATMDKKFKRLNRDSR